MVFQVALADLEIAVLLHHSLGFVVSALESNLLNKFLIVSKLREKLIFYLFAKF
jgi:hypothetical protein